MLQYWSTNPPSDTRYYESEAHGARRTVDADQSMRDALPLCRHYMRRGDNRLITVSSSSRRRGCSMPVPDNEAMADNDRKAEVNNLGCIERGHACFIEPARQPMANLTATESAPFRGTIAFRSVSFPYQSRSWRWPPVTGGIPLYEQGPVLVPPESGRSAGRTTTG